MLTSVKMDILRYCQTKKYSLEDLFAVMDKNKDKDISLTELRAGLKDAVKESSIVDLFRLMDADNSNSISIDELRGELNIINAAIVLDGIKASATKAANGKFNVDMLFNTVDNNKSGTIDIFEFEELVRLAYKSCEKSEIDLLFHVVDKNGQGFINKD